MAGGKWDPTSLPIRPGLYMNFVEAAESQIAPGPRGIVAMPIFTYGTGAEAGKFYVIESEKQAIDTFGVGNVQPIRFALQAGASKVLAYAMPQFDPMTEAETFNNMRDAFTTQYFNVFVYPEEVSETEKEATVDWVKSCRDNEGFHFMYVAGGDDTSDQDPVDGNARSQQLKDDYVVNLINGVVIDGVSYNSSKFAPYIAGLIAGYGINRSITYAELPVDDVTKRLKNSEIEVALKSGSLVLTSDGNVVLVEQGIVTNSDENKRRKIRSMRVKQALAYDIPTTAKRSYIGKLDNNADGQAALVAAIKRYLEILARENVLANPNVYIDPNYESTGDAVFVRVEYTDVDSMERMFFTVNVQ